MANKTIEACVEYGVGWARRTPMTQVEAGAVACFELTDLAPGAATSYRLRYRTPNASSLETGPTGAIRTQRRPGDGFTFYVQGDSHPERTPKMCVPELYERILQTAAKDKPDFFICMGDDFSVDTLREANRETVAEVYRRQAPYLSLIGAPVYLVNGNHEQGALANIDGTPDNVAVLAQNARNSTYAQPAPDGFYSGDEQKVEHIGLLRDYFAWTWGDALFVVIDPYWHSKTTVDNAYGTREKGTRDLWDVTLGDQQYQWLKKTLLDSRAKFKFVFTHHVLGTGRGGVERAPFFEWGGRNQRGASEFASHRPGWDLPIHQLMVKAGVDVFFQGHDHIFAKQVLDGVIYQTTPTPADASGQLLNGDAYTVGDKLPGAGLVRVAVDAEKAKVEFVRALLPADEKDGHKHGEVAYAYEIPAQKAHQNLTSGR